MTVSSTSVHGHSVSVIEAWRWHYVNSDRATSVCSWGHSSTRSTGTALEASQKPASLRSVVWDWESGVYSLAQLLLAAKHRFVGAGDRSADCVCWSGLLPSGLPPLPCLSLGWNRQSSLSNHSLCPRTSLDVKFQAGTAAPVRLQALFVQCALTGSRQPGIFGVLQDSTGLGSIFTGSPCSIAFEEQTVLWLEPVVWLLLLLWLLSISDCVVSPPSAQPFIF